MNYKIARVEENKVTKALINELAAVICYEEPEMTENLKLFWDDWFSGKIAGEKATIIAYECSKDSVNYFGVVRFWQTPYCEGKWLIEGLKVIPPMQQKGIGRDMLSYGIELLKNKKVNTIFVNISKNNIASIRLHECLGFKKVSTGAINSYGDYRPNMDQYQLTL